MDGHALGRTAFYELHVGTFTPEGTFAAAMDRLPHLRDLGVTAIELMPVADFPGRWNWGYDGVAPFAPARCYGVPDDLRRLVDTAHGLGLAVYLDVVYNHFGPDGAYQNAFSPRTSLDRALEPLGRRDQLRRTRTPMACAPTSSRTRSLGARISTSTACVSTRRTRSSTTAGHILAEIASAVHAAAGGARQVLVIAEDPQPRLPRPTEAIGRLADWTASLGG